MTIESPESKQDQGQSSCAAAMDAIWLSLVLGMLFGMLLDNGILSRPGLAFYVSLATWLGLRRLIAIWLPPGKSAASDTVLRLCPVWGGALFFLIYFVVQSTRHMI